MKYYILITFFLLSFFVIFSKGFADDGDSGAPPTTIETDDDTDTEVCLIHGVAPFTRG